jgi:hypothetical protein
MLRERLMLISLVVCLVALPAAVECGFSGRLTVLPVTLSSSLSSATACVGDTFSASYAGSQCGGFPCGTTFTGTVTGVVRAACDAPGQIVVRFTRATLPDGSCVTINGGLTPLTCEFVYTDPATGSLMLKNEVRRGCSSFVAASGCAVYIGVFCRGEFLLGSVAGSPASICAGAGPIAPALGQDVVVPAGVSFGIVLAEPVCTAAVASILRNVCPAVCGAGPPLPAVRGAGPRPVGPAPIAGQPYLSDGVLMVPLRIILGDMGIALKYDKDTNTASFVTSLGSVTHEVGSKSLRLNGESKKLSAASAFIGSDLYVPADAIYITTGKQVTWNAKTGKMQVK